MVTYALALRRPAEEDFVSTGSLLLPALVGMAGEIPEECMDRQIARYGYWIGLACMLISLVWRGLTLLWAGIPEKLGLVWYSTFWKGGALLLLVSIASVNYAWLQRQATQDKPERTTARAA